MKFKKIILNNFRQFKGETSIDFSTNDEQNITVIYGEITGGKTTLLQAFRWALYGEVNLQEPNKLLNFEEEEEMKAPGEERRVSVELMLELDDGEYSIKREQKYYVNEKGNISSSEAVASGAHKSNGIWKKIPDLNDTINKILPFDLSSYFFFDGERMDVISSQQRQGTKEIGNSVKAILGLEHYSAAINHLSEGRTSVMAELRSKLNTSADSKLEQLKKDIEYNTERINNKKEKILLLEDEIKKLQASKELKEQIILNNKLTLETQKQKNNMKNELENAEDKMDRMYSSYYSYFNNYYMDFFYYGLIHKVGKLNDILNSDIEGIPEMHAKSIEYLIERGFCLCGEKINKDEQDKHYCSLIKEKNKLPPLSIGSSVHNYKKDVEKNIQEDKALAFKNEINEKYKDIYENRKKIFDLRERIESLSKEIELDIDVGRIESEVRDLENKISNYKAENIADSMEIDRLTEENKRKNAELINCSQYNAKNAAIYKQMQYTEKMTTILKRYYKEKEKELISRLEVEINKYLSQMYKGERYMVITDDYKFRLQYSKDGEEVDSIESEGLGTIKAMAFMCGLLEVSREKILDDVQEESLYPLIFDAPFSKIDSHHRAKVMEALPEIASQVILFTREEKDLEDMNKKTKNKIGINYKIKKISEKHSEIEIKEEN